MTASPSTSAQFPSMLLDGLTSDACRETFASKRRAAFIATDIAGGAGDGAVFQKCGSSHTVEPATLSATTPAASHHRPRARFRRCQRLRPRLGVCSASVLHGANPHVEAA